MFKIEKAMIKFKIAKHVYAVLQNKKNSSEKCKINKEQEEVCGKIYRTIDATGPLHKVY